MSPSGPARLTRKRSGGGGTRWSWEHLFFALEGTISNLQEVTTLLTLIDGTEHDFVRPVLGPSSQIFMRLSCWTAHTNHSRPRCCSSR